MTIISNEINQKIFLPRTKIVCFLRPCFSIAILLIPTTVAFYDITCHTFLMSFVANWGPFFTKCSILLERNTLPILKCYGKYVLLRATSEAGARRPRSRSRYIVVTNLLTALTSTWLDPIPAETFFILIWLWVHSVYFPIPPSLLAQIPPNLESRLYLRYLLVLGYV
jgi:hypothetical protein